MKKQTNKVRHISRYAVMTLTYGIYASLCHAVMIFLFFRVSLPHTSALMLSLRVAPMLEYTAMSLTITVIGAALLDLARAERHKK